MLRPYLLSEHTGCGHTRSAFENTRTTHTNALMRWFTWNMPYHAEHHAYPSVPFHALPALNRLVDDRLQNKGAGYRKVVRGVWAHMRARMAASCSRSGASPGTSSAERSVGTERGRTCRSRGAQ